MFSTLMCFGVPWTKHVGAHRSHIRETLSVRCGAPNAKLCQILSVKIGQLSSIFSTRNLGENHGVNATTHLIQNATRFSSQKSSKNSNVIAKY